MSVNSPVKKSENLFVGEARTLRWTLAAATNLAGHDLEFWVKAAAEDVAKLLSKTSGFTLAPSAAAATTITLQLAVADTEALAAYVGELVYRLIDTTEDVALAFGAFHIAA